MAIPTNELLLALRSPTSGWLAAMVCALEEAVQDPNFSDHHRNLVHQLLDANTIPATVASAASDRLAHFEQAVDEMNERCLTRSPLSRRRLVPAHVQN